MPREASLECEVCEEITTHTVEGKKAKDGTPLAEYTCHVCGDTHDQLTTNEVAAIQKL